MDDRLDLRCPFCAATIVLRGEWDATPNADEYTIQSDDIIVCTCGATFGDGDTLDILYADGPTGSNDAEDRYNRGGW